MASLQDPRTAFYTRWTTLRDTCAEFNALVHGDKLIDAILTDVRQLLTHEGDTLLTLAAAAQRSGYSPDHLARLIRTGAIPNAGRRGAPRIRLADLPTRPARRPPIDLPLSPHYDPIADARSLRDRR